MTPLPSVDSACSLIRREESQRKILDVGNLEIKSTALYSRNDNPKDYS